MKTPEQDAPKPVIFWHFGFQKTGTTTFQLALRRNLKHIAPYASLFPKAALTSELRRACMRYLDTRLDADLAAIRSAVSKISETVRKSGAPVAIVSDENFLGYKPYTESMDIFSAACELLPVFNNAASPLRSEFVFYTRNFERWLVSAHNQMVKQTRCTLDYTEWSAGIPFLQDWEPHQERIRASVDAPCHFFDLDSETASGRKPGEAILTLAGVPNEVIRAIAWPRRTNESLSAGALRIMLAINRSNLRPLGVKTLRDIVQKNASAFSDK